MVLVVMKKYFPLHFLSIAKSDSPARVARHAGVGTRAAGADDFQLVQAFDMDAVEAALIAHGVLGVGYAVGAFVLAKELGEALL